MDFIGLFPLFYFPEIGTAWLMGITGTIHILASHTSIGAALLFAFLAHKAYKEDRDDLYVYMKKYGMFLLIFSYVIGSITGPGIWYTATAASPRGISALIHNFVWVWATEWVFFVTEVIGVFVLVYFIGKIDRKTHLKMTYLFAMASIGTLALIIGIISFMMWPGTDAFYQTGSASDAFFGVNTFPHMFLRIGFMVLMSAVIGFIIAAALRRENEALATELIRKLAVVGAIGGLGTLIGFMWYIGTLPENAHALLEIYLPGIIQTRLITIGAMGLYLALAFFAPKTIRVSLAVAMLLIVGVVGLWPGEKLRESMRKPYVAGQYVYSNQIIARDVPGKGVKSEVETVAQHGLLRVNPWIPDRLRTVTDENRLEAGELLAKLACSNCHSLEADGLYRPLLPKFAGQDAAGIESFLTYALGEGTIPYMPKIKLPEDETRALAAWIASRVSQ